MMEEYGDDVISIKVTELPHGEAPPIPVEVDNSIASDLPAS